MKRTVRSGHFFLLVAFAMLIATKVIGQTITFDITTPMVALATPLIGAVNVHCAEGTLYAASAAKPLPAELGWTEVSKAEQKSVPKLVVLAASGRKLYRAVIDPTFCGASVTLSSSDTKAVFFVGPAMSSAEATGPADNPDELVQAVLDRQDSIEKKTGGYVQFALSLGWRHITDGGDASSLYDASINPADSTVHLDKRNRGAFLLSGVVAVYPWVKKTEGQCGHGIRWLGFVGNVNLAEFTNSTAQATFNKKIEGGYGVAFRFSSHFSLAITYEKVFSRRPREWVIEKEGEQIYGSDGNIVATINQEDPNLFIEDNFNSISVKMVYRLK